MMPIHATQFAKWRQFRFSLATFLFVSLCVGAIFAGYQSGHRYGFNLGKAKRYDDSQISEVYNTTMFIWPDLPALERAEKIDSLKQLIKTTGSPTTWSKGTDNEITEFPQNQSVIVTAPGWVHHQIRDLITQLERLATRAATDEILPQLQRLTSQGKTQDYVFPDKSPKNNQLASAWLDGYYEAAVTRITREWGPPHYQGKCLDPGFPTWSLDQQIATWPRANGLSYISLRVTDDGHTHVVAGWRENS